VVPEVQNFAGPRAGWLDYAKKFGAEIDTCFRLANEWDILPKLPPARIFEHVRTEVKLDGGFTLDELVAHSMEKSYGPGLLKLISAAQCLSGGEWRNKYPREQHGRSGPKDADVSLARRLRTSTSVFCGSNN
jgi:hypothetical protein